MTVLPDRGRLSPPQRRRKLRGVTRNDTLNVVGAAAAGLCGATLLFGRLAAFSGLIGFVAVFYVLFLVAYASLVFLSDDGPAVVDKVMTVVLYTAAILMFAALTSVVLYILIRGHRALTHLNFFTQDMSNAGPLSPLTVGGIRHALIGSLLMITVALLITVPLGITCAVYLNESRSRLSKFVRTIVEAMTALPSIVAGLFIYATWILSLHHEKSAFAASLAISVMMLPIIIRTCDVVLRLVPGNLKEASAALGAPAWRTVWHVTLPTAKSGLATGVILGTARGIGETSPVLLTAGFTAAANTNILHGPNVSLPLAVFEFVKSPQPNFIARGFATAAFLLLVVLALFAVARVIGGRGPGHVTKRKAARIRRQSQRDIERFRQRDARMAAAGAAPGTSPITAGGIP
jgi:phosphate transport system permease protein